MQKNLVALAALGFCGIASAQSSVTLFGIVDATVTRGTGSISDRTRLNGSGLQSSRLGFRGTEDLGGGLYAKFVLEAGLGVDSGVGQATNTNNQASGAAPAAAGGQGLTFNRQSYVGLGGGWGEVRFGRQYTPAYNSESMSDPFGQNGVGTVVFATAGASFNTITGVRASNMINYTLPSDLGGFSGEVAYYLGENPQNGAATENDGRGWGGRVKYTSGPIAVAAGYGRTKYATGDVVMSNIAGTYDFKIVKAWAGYVRNTVASVRSTGWLLGLTVPVGLGEIRTSYSTHETHLGTDPTQKQIAVGYVHNLSKRTALYTTYARVKNSGGSAFALNAAVTGANASSSGFDIGIRHSF